MIENRSEQPRDTNRLKNSVEFLFGKDDPSEDLEWLFAEGRVEQLVQEGRTPLNIGTISSPEKEKQAYYQIPPKGVDPRDLKEIYGSMGCYVFVHKLGKQRIGSTFTLDNEQVVEIEERIAKASSAMASKKVT